MAQRHPSAQWIVFQLAPGGIVAIGCEICRVEARLSLAQADAFTRQHATHQSASPTHLGLGDLVAKAAQPVARALGVPTNCAPCEARKHALNNLAPRVLRK